METRKNYQLQKQSKFFRNVLQLIRLPAVRIFILLVTSTAAYQYFQTKIYDLPENLPFSGDRLYNPYQQIDSIWLKANFHAHSRSWFGITDGKQSAEEMVAAYLDFGYDVACLSEYHKINPQVYMPENIVIPVYEHGMNISKQHHLGIGASEVKYFDVMLWQNDHIKQFLLNMMNERSAVVCLNHPGLRHGHSIHDIGKLTGYHCMEVLNRHRNYSAHWDAALSAGRPVWILGNDDCHDLNREKLAVSWNLLNSSYRNPESVLQALRMGKTIAVQRTKKINDLDSIKHWASKNKGAILRAVRSQNNEVTFLFNGKVNAVHLIGQRGRIRKSAVNADSIHYLFTSEDTYLRAEIEMDFFTVYLNPIIRYSGNVLPDNTALAKTNFMQTFCFRMTILIGYIFLICVLFPSWFSLILFGPSPKPYSTYEQAGA